MENTNETKDIGLMKHAMEHCVEVAQQHALRDLQLIASGNYSYAEIEMYASTGMDLQQVAWMAALDYGVQ